MKLFVTGDFHGDLDIKKITSKNWPEQKELTNDDVLVQLGDFGLLWSNPQDKCEKYWLNWLGNKPFTLAFVDGNHCNFNLINQLPIIEKWGGKVHIIETDNKPIYHLIRGEIYQFGDKKCIALGGASSQDKAYRLTNISWWEEELWTYKEQDYISSQIIDNNDIDYVFAHTCPSDIGKLLLDGTLYYQDKMECQVAKAMNDLLKVFPNFKPKQWHFGHWHKDFSCVYNDVFYQCHYNSKPVQVI